MSINSLPFNSKAPTSKRNHVGIEIECVVPYGWDQNSLGQEIVKSDLQWNVHVGHDGSINIEDYPGWKPKYKTVRYFGEFEKELANRNVGVEFRILAEDDDVPEVLSSFDKILKKIKAHANSSCGLHVHLDMRNRDLNRVYNNMYMFQDVLFQTQPVSRYKNEYCIKLPRLFKTDPDARYYAINRRSYNEHRTLEIRLHEGTVNVKEIKMWVYLLIKIANLESLIEKKQTNFNMLKLPDPVKGYFDDRLKKYG